VLADDLDDVRRLANALDRLVGDHGLRKVPPP
jgi:hypothetical protein